MEWIVGLFLAHLDLVSGHWSRLARVAYFTLGWDNSFLGGQRSLGFETQ